MDSQNLHLGQTLFRLLEEFIKFPGLAVNPTKTEGMWIGSQEKIEKKRINEPIKALTKVFSMNRSQICSTVPLEFKNHKQIMTPF